MTSVENFLKDWPADQLNNLAATLNLSLENLNEDEQRQRCMLEISTLYHSPLKIGANRGLQQTKRFITDTLTIAENITRKTLPVGKPHQEENTSQAPDQSVTSAELAPNAEAPPTAELPSKPSSNPPSTFPSKTATIVANEGHQSENLTPPSYETLIKGLAENLDVFDEHSDLSTLEQYICQAVIVEALGKMSPAQRKQFFEQPIDLGVAVSRGNNASSGMAGPTRTLALLGAANLPGLSLYATATTALAFVTHAVGIQLPFAITTGLTATAGFLIGPVGWLAAGTWFTWALTQPAWKKLLPCIILMISVRAESKVER